MKYSVGDEFPEVIFNWMDDKNEVKKAGTGELFDNKNIILIAVSYTHLTLPTKA